MGVGNPGSYGGENTQESMYGDNGLGTGSDYWNSQDESAFGCIVGLMFKISVKVGKLSYKTVNAIVQGYFGNPMPGVSALEEWETAIPDIQRINEDTMDCIGH